MSNNETFQKIQSGFPSLHSTETFLVKNKGVLLLAAYTGLYYILILLDLQSAFDTVDHDIVFSSLKNYVGISNMALNWLISLSVKQVLLCNAWRCLLLFCSFYFLGFPNGLFWAPFYSPYTCYAWDKSCIAMTFFSVTTCVTPYYIS